MAMADPFAPLRDWMISLYRGGPGSIDRTELIRWLVDSGWEQEAATALADRFFADSLRLARRLAAMAP